METTSQIPPIQIALIGDYDREVIAHQAIPRALSMATESADLKVRFEWLPTDSITSTSQLNGFDGFWCVPASPYRNRDGALLAIRYAREQRRPFLGTCGGFQHALLEYARNVLGWADAEHGETSPDAERALLTPLSCSLVEAVDNVRLVEGSLIADTYGALDIHEGYHCRYGVNPEFEAQLLTQNLHATGHDSTGDLRVVELRSHPFFVATLFQPERAALAGTIPPLVSAFLTACARYPA